MRTKNYYLLDQEASWLQPQRLPKRFLRFRDEVILPRVKLPGYKLFEKVELLGHMTNQLIKTCAAGRCVRDSRDNSSRGFGGAKVRKSVWDSLVKAGLANMHTGSEFSGPSRYGATDELMKLKKHWSLGLLENTRLKRNTELLVATQYAPVVIKSGKRDPATGKLLPEEEQHRPLPFDNFVAPLAHAGKSIRKAVVSWLDASQGINRDLARDMPCMELPRRFLFHSKEFFSGIESEILRVNGMNAKHAWEVDAVHPQTGRKFTFQPCVGLRWVHTGGELFRAARLYSCGELSGQNLGKDARVKMRIDGHPVCEFDYSCLHVRILYHLKGLDPSGDLYRPRRVFPVCYADANRAERKLLRDVAKLATNRCLSVKSRGKANSSVGNFIYKHPKKQFLFDCLKREGIRVSGIVDRIVAAHPKLEDYFFKAVNLELMTRDGWLMLNILRALASKNVPVLAIHDSLVCRVNDARLVRDTMLEQYKQQFHFYPTLKRIDRPARRKISRRAG